MTHSAFRDLKLGARLDLHLHSTRSDGAFSPKEVLARCAAGRLDVIAMTDHDLPPDLEPGRHDVDGRPIHVIAGAEVSGQHAGREYHLLVYFPGPVPESFRAFCREQCQARAERYIEAIRRLGFPELPPPDAHAVSGERAITRLHLAHALVEHGHATHIGDAFARFLGDRHQLVPMLAEPLVEVIRRARAAGGITSWAHPSLPDVEQHLGELVRAGLHALEGYRPQLRTRTRARLRKAARAHGIAMTGGSDWHGWADQRVGLFAVSPREVSDFVDLMHAA